MSRFTPPGVADAVRRLLALVLVDPESPRLSDLVKMFLEDNVKDKSVISLESDVDGGWYNNTFDPDVRIIKLNKMRVLGVLDNLAVVELRDYHPISLAYRYEGAKFVQAADPEFFEKIWAHIADLDERLDCPGFSLIEKPDATKVGKPPDFTRGYPAFEDGEN